MKKQQLILHLHQAGMGDVQWVGGKNASLGEMIQHLSPLGIRVPAGIVLTVEAYRQFLTYNELDRQIPVLLRSIDPERIDSLREYGHRIRSLIQDGKFPSDTERQIKDEYRRLSDLYHTENADVAVRSSATAEDLPDASFAGQQETYLNVIGVENLMDAIRNCFASVFTDRAISYRQHVGYDHFQTGLSVCIQKMVRSDLAVSGVAFSLDTESGFKDAVVISSSYGLGELIVQGSVSPDEFVVFKPALKKGFPSVIEKKIGTKDRKMIYADSGAERVRTIATTDAERSGFCMTEEQILLLADWVMTIEEYYSRIKGHWCPMDVEWAIDGKTGEMFIVQARPETIHSRKKSAVITTYQFDKQTPPPKVLLQGIAVGDRIGAGKVKVIDSFDKTSMEEVNFSKGDVLVTDMTDPDWEPLMKIASAIVTNKGGRTCHAAIIAREFGIPAIVASRNGTEVLSDGDEVTVSCAEGEVGFVYQGIVPFCRQEIKAESIPQTDIPVLLNIASPEQAFHYSHLPQRGVGLAREEFIITNYIKAHPLALLKDHLITDPELRREIGVLTKGFESGADYFTKKLSYGIAKIAAAFYPNRVIVRFSDFKSNEYRNLPGGNYFEPEEENPMIGWRGASRYYSEQYMEAFGLECKAIQAVRNRFGLTNVTVMIPFCRTVDELLRVYHVMKNYGLERGKDGLEVYLMAELPSNIILADEFSKYVDGFSIGSNDLTQLTLGLDRDSSLVAHLYDERNRAVKRMISMLIDTAKKSGVKVGICGQGPSDFPDFTRFLVEYGIDSISVTPDSFLKTVTMISAMEKNSRSDSVLRNSGS